MLNVAVLNGGRGAASIIPALLKRRGLNVTSVVNAYDDGKSTGDIRRFFDMLGPSDIRKVQELMLPEDDPYSATYRSLFQYRYPVEVDRSLVIRNLVDFSSGGSNLAGIEVGPPHIRGPLQRFVSEFIATLSVIEKIRSRNLSFSDCSLMNCIYAGAFLSLGRSLEEATRFVDRMFRLKGTVLPNSLENKRLAAIRENGEILYSEAEIVELRSNVRLQRIYLLDHEVDRTLFEHLSLAEKRHFLERHHSFVMASAGVRLALQQADIIIYAAGTQHSSLYPTYMSRGISETIASNKGSLKVFITNIGADYETPSYTTTDYVTGAYKYLCLPSGISYPMHDLFSCILVNTSRIKADETYVEHDASGIAALSLKCVEADLEDADNPGKHDGTAIVSLILSLYEEMDSPGI